MANRFFLSPCEVVFAAPTPPSGRITPLSRWFNTENGKRYYPRVTNSASRYEPDFLLVYQGVWVPEDGGRVVVFKKGTVFEEKIIEDLFIVYEQKEDPDPLFEGWVVWKSRASR